MGKKVFILRQGPGSFEPIRFFLSTSSFLTIMPYSNPSESFGKLFLLFNKFLCECPFNRQWYVVH